MRLFPILFFGPALTNLFFFQNKLIKVGILPSHHNIHISVPSPKRPKTTSPNPPR